MDKNHYLIELSEGERTDFGRVDFEEQPEPQKVFSAIWELESEVNNGGFDQYFRNIGSGTLMQESRFSVPDTFFFPPFARVSSGVPITG